MNQQQRDFLVKTIEGKTKAAISALESGLKERPSLSNYLWRSAMNKTLEFNTPDEMAEAFYKKALRTKEGKNWMKEERGGAWITEIGTDGFPIVNFEITNIIKLPKEYFEELQKWNANKEKIEKQVMEMHQQLETLIFRIKLASDKVLQQIINEVDDMGNLSLLDTKIKLLNQ